MIQTIKKVLAVLVIIFLLPGIFFVFIYFSIGDINDQAQPQNDPPEDNNWENDTEGFVNYIVDGDTFEINLIGRIRLADIDSPDLGEKGYDSAKNYLHSLIYNKKIYLDIDDMFGTDDYGRIIAVAYVQFNSTHLLNVNKDLLNRNHATIWDFLNEFNPYDWSLYVIA